VYKNAYSPIVQTDKSYKMHSVTQKNISTNFTSFLLAHRSGSIYGIANSEVCVAWHENNENGQNDENIRYFSVAM
jgi:hypothetical protein